MEPDTILRIGLHIEQPDTLILIQALLSLAGHQTLTEEDDGLSLTTYLDRILEQVQHIHSKHYDLLILEEADDIWQSHQKALMTIIDQLTVLSLPMVVLMDAYSPRLKEVPHNHAQLTLLPRSPVVMKTFFQAIGQLTHTSTQIPVSIISHIREVKQEGEERIRVQERKRLSIRIEWLGQRQEWLDQRQIWLKQRQIWLEERRKGPDPQQEWLFEQQVWIEQQQEELHHLQKKLLDLRHWLERYQKKVDGEQPPFREAES
jgi:hypothetical protein